MFKNVYNQLLYIYPVDSLIYFITPLILFIPFANLQDYYLAVIARMSSTNFYVKNVAHTVIETLYVSLKSYFTIQIINFSQHCGKPKYVL